MPSGRRERRYRFRTPGSPRLRSGQEVSVEEGALEGTSVFSFLKTDRPTKVSPRCPVVKSEAVTTLREVKHILCQIFHEKM